MIATQVNQLAYTGDGVSTDFAFPAVVLSELDVVVIQRVTATGVDTTLVLDDDYLIIGAQDAVGRFTNGVTVRALTAPPATVQWIIYQNPAVTQEVDLTDNGLLPVEAQVELPLDRLTVICQRLQTLIGRSLRQPDGDPSAITTLPPVGSRGSMFLGFDASGNPIAAAGTSANLGPVSSYINTLLTAADALTARATLGAAEVTTNGAPNPFINAAMDIWQRNTSFPAVGSGIYTADRWVFAYQVGATGVVTINRSTNVPSVAQAGRLFNYSLEVDVTTADTSISGTDTYYVTQRIEGGNWRQLAQRTLTLSFWVMSSKTGIHCVGFRNIGVDRSYVAEYTVNVANTWEYKTITIVASPSGGTWNYTTGIGVEVSWCLAAGSTFQTTPGAWQTGSFITTANQVNVMDNTANFFRLTGVRLEGGVIATPLHFTPYELDLFRCRRYYQQSYREGLYPGDSSANNGYFRFSSLTAGAAAMSSLLRFRLPMRTATPTVVLYNTTGVGNQVRNLTDAADCSGSSVTNHSESECVLTCTGNVGNGQGDTMAVHWTAEAEL